MSHTFGERLRRLAVIRLPGFQLGVRRALLGPGEILQNEARFLGELVRRAPKNRPIIEIGTLFGRTTRVLAMFKHPETKLITIDKFQWNPHGLSRKNHERITRDIFRKLFEHDNVQLLQTDKSDFYKTYSGPPPGLVLLDANHSYESTLEDLLWAKKSGAAIICGHDHNDRFPGVMRAVIETGGVAEIVGSLYVLALN